MIFRDIFV